MKNLLLYLPVYDVEYLTTGLSVNSIRPVTPQPYIPEFFYDDEAISETLPGGQPELELDGCVTPCHYWDDLDYGNVNTINTFWYAYRSSTTVQVPFETPPPTCAGCPFIPFEILGRVILDVDANGSENGTDFGFVGITVSVYEDANNNGTYQPGTDQLIDSDVTDANGDYSLIGEIATNHLIVIDQTTLPFNSTLTTDNLYGVPRATLEEIRGKICRLGSKPALLRRLGPCVTKEELESLHQKNESVTRIFEKMLLFFLFFKKK